MALKFQIKRGTVAPGNGVLAPGEFGYNTQSKKLYVGNGPGLLPTLINDNIGGEGGSSISVSELPPENPNPGDLWWNSSELSGALFLYYDDGLADENGQTTAQWVQINTIESLVSLSSIDTDIIPDTTEAYDLGSPTRKWRDLYLSGNSLYLGDIVMTNNSGVLSLQHNSGGTLVPTKMDMNFSDLSNKPTTLSGYGITDGVSSSEVDLLTKSDTILGLIVESYKIKSGETINARDFVDYIDSGEFTSGNESRFNSVTTDSISAVRLSNSKILVAYRDVTNANGVANIGTISGNNISWGNSSIFNVGVVEHTSVIVLADNKIVINYRDGGNSGKGTSIIGIIIGDNISWSNKTVFNDVGTTSISGIKISDSKIIVSYSDTGRSSHGFSIVGTISGNNIIWGSPNLFNNISTTNISAAKLSDSSIFIAYRDGTASNGIAIIGTLNEDNTISWNSPSTFNNTSTSSISAVVLSNSVVVVSYRNEGNSNYGTSIVGLISNDVVTWGSPSLFNSKTTIEVSAVALSSNKIVVTYRDFGNSSYGTARIGVISGNTITWSATPFVFNAESTINLSAAALSGNRVLATYRDASPQHGTAIIIEEGKLLIPSTTEIFGIAKTGGTGGDTIDVLLKMEDISGNHADAGYLLATTAASTYQPIGNYPILTDGKLSDAVLPALAITDTYVVSDEASMLALVAETGDVAVRTDINTTFILSEVPASVLGNWKRMLTPGDGVQSLSVTAPISSTGGTNPTISINAASTSAAGSMSAVDKTKLDGIENSANNYIHPDGFTNQPANILTDANVISQITINGNGHVTGVQTRGLTPANIGAAPSSHTHVISDITNFSAVNMGSSPQSNPSSGSMWWDTETGKLKIYYVDGDPVAPGNSGQWVDAFNVNGALSVDLTGYVTTSALNNYILNTGGTLTGALVAQNNTSYTTKQVRNIILSTGDAVLGQMQNGDIWIKYK